MVTSIHSWEPSLPQISVTPDFETFPTSLPSKLQNSIYSYGPLGPLSCLSSHMIHSPPCFLSHPVPSFTLFPMTILFPVLSENQASLPSLLFSSFGSLEYGVCIIQENHEIYFLGHVYNFLFNKIKGKFKISRQFKVVRINNIL